MTKASATGPSHTASNKAPKSFLRTIEWECSARSRSKEGPRCSYAEGAERVSRYSVAMYGLISLALVAIFTTLALLHVVWAFGRQGKLAAVVPTRPSGEPLFRPGPVSCLAVAAALAVAALLCAWRGGWVQLDLPNRLAPLEVWAIWAIAAVFFLRAVGDFRYVGFTKRIRGTRFAQRDTWFYSPLCLVIAGLAAGLAGWAR